MHWAESKDNAPDIRRQIGISPSILKKKIQDLVYFGGRWLDEDDSLEELPCRLEPGETDRMAYRQIVKAPPHHGGQKNKRFTDIYKIIGDELEAKLQKHGPGYVKQFVEFLGERVYIMGIFMSDEANAYEVFEILNARSMRLTPVDLIKNKLFSCFKEGDREIENAHNMWRRAFFSCKESVSRMQGYVRCYLQMTSGEKIDPKLLYRHLRNDLERNQAKKVARANKMLHDLDDNCHLFNALFSKDDHFWEHFDSEIREHVGYLHEYRVVHTLMLSILYSKKPKDFVCGAFRMLNSFIKRTRAVRERFSNLEYYEERFAELAKRFKDGTGPRTVRQFLAVLKAIDDGEGGLAIIPDGNFIEEMSRRPRIKISDAMATLVELYHFVEQENKSGIKIDSDTVTMEHILPHKWNNVEWPDFQDEDHASRWGQRIGNLALLHGSSNSKASNRGFSFKKSKVYSKDRFKLTNELCQYNGWSAEDIQRRSRRLAEIAAKVWSFKNV